MKESISIKGLNNKIDKLFEDELEDVKIIKDVANEKIDSEEIEHKKELEELEKLQNLINDIKKFFRTNLSSN